MAQNIWENFIKLSIGSSGKISDYIPTIGAAGDFKRIEDIQVIINSWNNILLTPLRTYMWDPEYGSELHKYVFDPADPITEDAIKDEIMYTLQRFDDRATITSVDVKFLPQRKGFNVSIDVLYEGESGNLNATIDDTSYFNITGTSAEVA